MQPTGPRKLSLPISLLALSTLATSTLGQQLSSFVGEYAGKSGPVHIRLHLVSRPDGSLSGTIDSPDGHLLGMPISDIRVNGNNLSFSVPAVHGAWTGFLSADGKALSGIYNQGGNVPLDLKRVAAEDSEKAENQTPVPPTSPAQSVASPASCVLRVRWLIIGTAHPGSL
jgi:hypothetical protein